MDLTDSLWEFESSYLGVCRILSWLVATHDWTNSGKKKKLLAETEKIS